MEPTPVKHKLVKKRRLFKGSEETDLDPIPAEFLPIRQSDRIVREESYKTISNLCGHGLSINEASKAVCKVGNGLFGSH